MSRPTFPSIPDPPAQLVSELAAGNCVLFAGTGIGRAAGHPSWSALLRRIVEWLPQDLPDAELNAQIEAGQTQLVAEILTSSVAPELLREAVHAAYAPAPGMGPSPLYDVLGRLPVQGVITANWGRQLEWAFSSREPVLIGPHRSAIPGPDAFFFLYAYGEFEDDGPLLLSAEDFRRAVARHRDLQLFLGNVFETRTLLFVGASLEGIEQFMIGAGWLGTGSSRHFAVVDRRTVSALQRERMQSRYNVELVPMPYEDGNGWQELDRFLERCGDFASAVSLRGRPADDYRLSRLELDNIGPFEHLVLDLSDGTWATALLGDNGSGKTTVLRAIALVLAGDSARSDLALGDLLRAGAQRGRITAHLGAHRYQTTLIREGDRVMLDGTGSATPVQAGAYLAVGFPAVRGVTAGAGAAKGRGPSADSVLPLLRNASDARLNNLQEWVATNWLASRDASRPDAAGRQRLVDETLVLLRDLTPGFEFSVNAVDPDTSEVLLDTEHGVVPLRLLSRGLSSIIGFAGVLAQLLHETYPERRDANEQAALALIDELDAHLHPAWQREILPLLHKWFPRVQFIVTTHSPLVVGNAEGAQVLRVEAGEVHALPSSVGWRSDQILTGDAFELETTLDQGTADRLGAYRRLLGRRDRSESDDQRLQQLARELRVRLPRPESTPAERQAADLFETWLDQRIASASADDRERVLEEARALQANLRPRRQP